MENREFFIRYLDNQPVLIETHIDGNQERIRPLSSVAHLVAAFQGLANSPLASTFAGDITLHLPVGVDRKTLEKDWFSSTDPTGTTLRPGLALSCLNDLTLDDLNPLIIKSKNDAGQGIFMIFLT